ncbi:MAG: hypothetical protein RR845_24265 [Pseudomonas sp.]
MEKVSANLLSLEEIEPDCSKRIAHRNSARCRRYEIKWCTGYKSEAFSGIFCTSMTITNLDDAPTVTPQSLASQLPQFQQCSPIPGTSQILWELACQR